MAKDIHNSLKRLGYNVPATASSGPGAIAAAAEHRPELVLMDIMLKGEMSGIEAAEAIRVKFGIPVIFLTAYADESTLGKAKLTEPYGYILKPFKEIDLHTAIEIAIYKHQKEMEVRKERDIYQEIVMEKGSDAHLFVKSNSRLVKVNTKEICYIEALKDYVIIFTSSAKYTVHSTMKDIDSKLNQKEFMRMHRSFIVRIDKIIAIEQGNLVVEPANKLIPIGGSYKDDLEARLNFV